MTPEQQWAVGNQLASKEQGNKKYRRDRNIKVSRWEFGPPPARNTLQMDALVLAE